MHILRQYLGLIRVNPFSTYSPIVCIVCKSKLCMIENLVVSGRVYPYCVYKGMLRTKSKAIKRKYGLAYRQGTMAIDTAEIKR